MVYARENGLDPPNDSLYSPRTDPAVLPIVPPQPADNVSAHSSVKNQRVSPCAGNTCCSQCRHLRANDHPVRAKHACTDGEQSQNILHTSLVVRSQEERCRVRMSRVLVQEDGTYPTA